MFVLACVIRAGFEVVDLRGDYHLCNFLGSWVVIERSWVYKKDALSKGSEVVISPLCWMMWISAVASLLARSCVGIHGTSQTLCVVSQSVGFLRASIWQQVQKVHWPSSVMKPGWVGVQEFFCFLAWYNFIDFMSFCEQEWTLLCIFEILQNFPPMLHRHSLGEQRRDLHRRIVFFFFFGTKDVSV